jgi:enamine deaminase RidA (YjgF/YER057c/UK114 family)
MSVRFCTLVAAATLLLACAALAPQPTPTCVHANEKIEREIGFCQAVRSGGTLHISGVTGQGSMDAAVRSVYTRLGKVLEANGLTWANVVKENVYATDLDAFIKNKDIRKEFYGATLPAATWVQVQRLYLPQFVLEVELTAEYPK